MSSLKVFAVVCDGASPNRRFFKLHRLDFKSNFSSDNVVYWTKNRYDLAGKRKIYFISDPPHLIKTIRNNIENSYGHRRTRNLKLNGLSISWQHFVELYEWDLGINRSSPDLRKLVKWTEEHINLSPRLRMRVYLAAQVLSNSCDSAFKLQGLEERKSTKTLVRMVNKFFDCVNVSKTYEANKSRNPDKEIYRSPDDPRLTWLTDDFLKFLNDWKTEVDGHEELSSTDRKKLCLSQQTLEGLRITARSIVELVPLLLGKYGAEFVLTDRFNQDSLEEHFSKQRMRGGGLTNPTLDQYGFNECKIILAKSALVASMRANTRERNKEDSKVDLDDDRLPLKKPRK